MSRRRRRLVATKDGARFTAPGILAALGGTRPSQDELLEDLRTTHEVLWIACPFCSERVAVHTTTEPIRLQHLGRKCEAYANAIWKLELRADRHAILHCVGSRVLN